MNISYQTTVAEILKQRPDAISIFADHGVDVSLECDESILDTELEICDSMCHIDDLDALVKDLEMVFQSKS